MSKHRSILIKALLITLFQIFATQQINAAENFSVKRNSLASYKTQNTDYSETLKSYLCTYFILKNQ